MTKGDKIRIAREAKGLTQEELGTVCGVSKQTIYKYEQGIITNIPSDKVELICNELDISPVYLMGWEAGESAPLPDNLTPIRFHQKPLVGSIACGTPILAEENITDYVDVPEHIQCDFALKCRGRSMINLGVKEGDIVYIRSQPEVQNGQIAAVIVDGMEAEATLKKFYRYDNQIVLVPANDEDKPFVYTGEEMARVHVQGLAVGFTHVFEQ